MAKKDMDDTADKKARRRVKAPNDELSASKAGGEAKSGEGDQEIFQHWVNEQLRKLYDPVLDEPIPEQMLELLRKSRRAD